MTTEELKMVLDTLATMGDDTKTAFIWWLVVDGIVPVIGWLLTATMTAAIMWKLIVIVNLEPSRRQKEMVESHFRLTNKALSEMYTRVSEMEKKR